MTTPLHTADTAAYMEKFLLLLSDGEKQSLPVLGSSMAPFLVHQRDRVMLARIDRPVRVGDICLYRRDSGAYILHRVCRVAKDGTCTMVGDAHTVTEPGIRPDQILAVAVSVCRKGREERPGTLLWAFFANIWPRIIPLRPAVLRLYTFLTKPFRRSHT